MIMHCNCNSPMQDKLHGYLNRVFNMRKSVPKGQQQPYRCIVCHAVRFIKDKD